MLDALTTVRYTKVRLGLANARAVALGASDADVVVMVDDDLVVTPPDGMLKLAEWAAESQRWVNPLIRYSCNFVTPLPGHTEVWDRVEVDDPRVVEALRVRGPGWIRVFDTGQAVATSQMGGACVAVPRKLVKAHMLEALRAWPINAGDEDAYLGRVLGGGWADPTVVAWHWGEHYVGKWPPGPVDEAVAAHREVLGGEID